MLFCYVMVIDEFVDVVVCVCGMMLKIVRLVIDLSVIER